MLDNSYTTRTDLTLEEVTALVRVRTALERGEITVKQFHMDTIWSGAHSQCKSMGCIGGWMGSFRQESHAKENLDFRPQNLRGGIDDKFMQHMHDGKFRPLFFPSDWIMNSALPEEGIRAINNFLQGMKRPWQFMRKDNVAHRNPSDRWGE